MQYRPEIDGLRTVAVLPVVLFHAGIGAFSGGFIGVDVFFVISGYLITSILAADLTAGRFSLLRFYERRARRILPAFFVVVMASIPFAFYLMMPDQLASFGKSLVAVTTFLSNVLFWRESDYFGVAAELKPLLHTWSLAVEEQYYLFFPILLFFLWKFRQKGAFWVILVLGLISLGAAEWAAQIKPRAAFFLLPFRAWELFAGSLCALVTFYPSRIRDEVLSAIGLALIVAPIFLFDAGTRFPGISAIPPVLGTSLIILFSNSQTVTGRFLSLKPMVALGLVSYSTYLWHQPLFSFARLAGFGEPPMWVMLLLALASIGLAVLTWRFVEQPFRGRQPILAKQSGLFTASILSLATVAAIGGFFSSKDGFPERLTDWQREILAFTRYDKSGPYRVGDCFLEPRHRQTDFNEDCWGAGEMMIWGDSHAAALASGLRQIEPDIGQLTTSGCPPVPGLRRGDFPLCQPMNDRFFEGIQARSPQTLIVHANWPLYGTDIAENLGEALQFLKASGVADIVVVGSAPTYSLTIPEIFLRTGFNRQVSDWAHADVVHPRRLDGVISRVAEEAGVRFVSLLDLLCEDDLCQATVITPDGPVPVTWDYGHMTQEGATLAAERLLSSIASQ